MSQPIFLHLLLGFPYLHISQRRSEISDFGKVLLDIGNFRVDANGSTLHPNNRYPT